MFKNAQIYNVDESYIFKYASRLEQALATKCKSMNIKKEKIQRIIQKKYIDLSFSSLTNIRLLSRPMNSLQEKISSLIHSIKNLTNRQGRTLSSVFLTLPSKVDYPDYYEIISKPIDFKRIESRHYSSIDELSHDLKLMFDNALLYNEPGSMIYRVCSSREW